MEANSNPSAEASSKSESTTTNQGTFTLFPKLPEELRLYIWNVVKEPRVVEVRFQLDGRKNKHKYFAEQPVLLHVCRESRIEALKRYENAFPSRWAMKRVRSNNPESNNVHFDFDIDILFIGCARGVKQIPIFLKHHKTNHLTRVQRVATPDSNHGDLAKMIAKFSGLRELMVTMNRKDAHHDSHMQCPWRGIGLHGVEEVKDIKDQSRYLPSQLTKARCDFSEFEQVGLFLYSVVVSFHDGPELRAWLPSSLFEQEFSTLIG